MGTLPWPFGFSPRCRSQRDMGAHINRRPHDASSRRHARRHGPICCRFTLARIHPTCLRASTFAPSTLLNSLPLITHTSPPRLTLSSQHTRAPPQPLCAKLSRSCRRGRTTSKRTRVSRRVSTPSLAQLDSTPGPVGVCGFLSNPCYVVSSIHEIIRRPLFRRFDRAYLSWPSAPLQQCRERHMRLGG
jgi:hypothetical protein